MAPRLIALVTVLVAAAHASSIYYAYAGQSCGTPGTKCRNYLVCQEKTCKVRAGQSCIGRESLCAKGLACVGKGGDKKCVRGRAIGKGGKCNSAGARCDPGLMCAGNKKKKVCVWPVGPGGWCAWPFYPCRSGLFCQKKFCRTPVNGDCKPKGSLCAHGTICAGLLHKRRCVYPVKKGGACGAYARQVCASGLICRNYRCASPHIAEGGDCTRKGSKCAGGLVCIGLPYQKKCVAPSGENGPCDSPFTTCQEDLGCNRATQKCRDGWSGQNRCNDKRPCRSGLVCRAGGPGRNRKTCAVLRNVGETCGAEFVCKGALKCKGGFCDY